MAPRSLAVVGASEASMWSQNLVANLDALAYEGRVHLVNPNRDEMFGRRCHRSVEAIGEPVDCAYVMVGTERAAPVLEECGRLGVRSAVFLTAGFKEVGGEGVLRERRLVARADELGVGILGPNCLGFVNYQLRLAAYGLLVVPPLVAGGVAFISQSGAMLLHVHRMAQARAIGLARMVSIGNEAQLTAADFVEAFAADPEVNAIGILLEGIRDGDRFLAAARAAVAARKPVVVFKVGRSEASARSVSAHTGSLAGEDEVVDAAFRQHAVVRVASLEELVETCALLSTAGWPEGGRTAVVTTSGGACGMVADLAVGTRISIPDFAPETKARLGALLPVFGTAQNPLDTTGVIVDQPELLEGCLSAVAAEGGFDAFLVNTDPPREPGPDPERIERRIAGLARAVRQVPYAAVAATAAVDLTPYAREVLTRHGVHFANGLTLGVRALDNAIAYGRLRRRAEGRAAVERRPSSPPSLAGSLNEVEAKRLLAGYGIAAVPERAVVSEDEAVAAAELLGYPVVVKLLSRAVSHKTEVGGVRLGLGDAEAVRRAFVEVTAAGGSSAEGALVARHVTPVAELIVGVKRDPVFGPVIVAGLGGVLVEVMRDVALRLPPVDAEEAREMLQELRGAALLEGVRGRPAADLDAAAAAVAGVSRLALDLGERLLALDVNPLFVMAEGEGVLAADALVELG